MNLSTHLTLEEFTHSQTASRDGIDNTLPPELLDPACRFAQTLFEPIRELVGRPLVVSSGYRSPRLNDVVGGAEGSFHTLALAADFTCPGVELLDLYLKVANSILHLPVDELIYEYGAWVHAQTSRPGEEPRRRLLMKFAGTSYLPFDTAEARARTPKQT